MFIRTIFMLAGHIQVLFHSGTGTQVKCRYKSGPAPRGGIPGPCPPKWVLVPPPNENCAPPKRGLCPKEINRLGAFGVQIEA